MKTKRNKKIQAYVYVILGPIISFLAIGFSIQMFFSGTFLAGMHTTRQILYVLMIVLFFVGLFMYSEGDKYLKKIRRRRK